MNGGKKEIFDKNFLFGWLFCHPFLYANLAFSNSGGSISIGGDLTFSSMMGSMNLGSTTMGFNYKTGDSGRSIDLYSTHVPTSFADSIRIGAATGIDTASITTPSLMMHMAASNAILQLTDRQGKMNVGTVINTMKAAWSAGKPLVTRGRVVLGLAKETVDRAQEQREISSASASGSNATTGGPMGEDPNDPKKKDKKENDVKYPDNPKENPASFRPLESSGAKKNLTDGSVWEKDTSSHGGEQWKRWDTQRSWEKGEKPTSVWPDGRVRK